MGILAAGKIIATLIPPPARMLYKFVCVCAYIHMYVGGRVESSRLLFVPLSATLFENSVLGCLGDSVG